MKTYIIHYNLKEIKVYTPDRLKEEAEEVKVSRKREIKEILLDIENVLINQSRSNLNFGHETVITTELRSKELHEYILSTIQNEWHLPYPFEVHIFRIIELG